MPLAFESLSHGRVAFGYFNIDVDLLLLERWLFGGESFASAVVELARAAAGATPTVTLAAHEIEDPGAMGDLMGAIHGVDPRGFLGAVYARFPFPADPAAFRQRAIGVDRIGEVEPLLARWARPTSLGLTVDGDDRAVGFGPIRFDWPWFRELVAYHWRGGYPRWLDDVRPDYLPAMRRAVAGSAHPLFEGQRWELERCHT